MWTFGAHFDGAIRLSMWLRVKAVEACASAGIPVQPTRSVSARGPSMRRRDCEASP